jgi:uncharacterized protein YdaU (DUF1376 family)
VPDPEFSLWDRPPLEIVVHLFMFHLGDYYAHTAHLSPMEDLAYRRIIDLYYLHEQPPSGTPEQIARQIRMRDQSKAVSQVLYEFFTEEVGCPVDNSIPVWRHKRCDKEIERYQAVKDGGRKGAAKRWAKGSDSPPMPNPSPPYEPPNANQEPRTNNHKPQNNKTRSTRFDLQELPDEWFDFCRNERQDIDPRKTFETFRDYWIAQPGSKGLKTDWFATWRNWVRTTKVSPNTKQKVIDEKSESIFGWGSNVIDMEDANGFQVSVR